MSKLCVNMRDNKFISLKNKYNLASSALENIIHAWYDISDNAEYDSNEFIEFLENSLCLDKIEYTSKSKYEKAHQIWEDLNKKYSKISKDQIKEAKNTARIIFGEDNYSIYETNEDGVFSLKIKEPSLKENEEQAILRNAPRDSEGRLLAPNGKPSNLTEKQYAQVRTKAFINWFGDWINDPENASKVVDENGEPLMVYHGSKEKFTTFRLDTKNRGSLTDIIKKGIYFSNEMIAGQYASSKEREDFFKLQEYKEAGYYFEEIAEAFGFNPRDENELNAASKYLMNLENSDGKFNNNLYAVFLNIRKPAEYDLKGSPIGSLTKEQKNSINSSEGAILYNVDETTARYRGEITVPGMFIGTDYIVFESNQIKSATDNIGEFSTTSDNIYEENIAYNRANSTRDDKLFNLVKGETSEASIFDIIKILEDSEYSNIINLLKSKFGNRSNDDKLLNGIKIKLVNPLDYGGYTSGTVKRMFPNGKRAVYNATEKTVYIDITASYTNGDASSVIMHELMHAITVDRILSNKDARERFEKIFDEYIKGELDESTARSEKHYLEEFIANIWSDPYTINRLKSIKSSNEDKTLWDKIKEFFTDLFSGIFADTKDDSLMAKASTEMIKLLESPVTRKATGIYEESNSQKDYKISYTPKGKSKQVYTIIGSHIYNKEGKEVFKEDSTDRNKIFANLAVSQGRAVVVEHKGFKYVVNQKGQILSTTTGRIMNWGSENGNRKAVLELADSKFDKKFSPAVRQTYTGKITSLKPNQIFVFGSNTQGRHGMGAAATAKRLFGAKQFQAEGLQGQSYAIITKDLTKDDKKNPSRTPEQIKEQIHKLYEFAKKNPNKEFLVAYSATGKNLNYYSNEAMAKMFASEEIPSNIVFEEGFSSLIFKGTTKLEQSVTKVISGGQTGVDTIGLQIAKELGIETGGTAPKGFLREKGIDSEDITSYGLVEISDEEQADYTRRKKKNDPYTGRTELNVRNSDGTVYFATDDDSAGLIATERSAKEWKKPFIKNPTAKQLIEWIKANNIRVLNVAGNRGSKLPKSNRVAKILREALQTEQSITKEDLIVNPNFFNAENRNNPSVKKAMEEISDKLGHIVNIRPLTKEEIEEENGLGSDAVIEFSSGESMELSFSAGSMALNGKKAYNMLKALGREKDNPYRKGEKVVDTSKTAPLFFAANVLAYDYFVSNPAKLQALNIGENPLVTLNKKLRGESYDTSKDDIAKGSTTPFILKVKENNFSKLAESRALVQQMIEDSNARIKFNPETHTYVVDGKEADTSVTQYIHGKKDIGAWGLPSSTLGNTVDTVVRDFFSGNVKKSYPNLNSKQLKSLLADCELIRKQFNKKFGEGNYEVVTTEFPIAAKYTVVEKDGTSTIKVMAGTMDMLVYDKDGNFYIYDMKTSRSGIKEDTKVGYSKQLTLYKEILESNYPQLRGKIKELNLLEFSISYPNPNNIEYYSSEDIEDGLEGQLYISDEEGGAIDIQDSSEYKAPTFKNTIPVQNINTTSLKSLDESFKESNISKAKKEIPVLDKTGWDTNPLITASERRFLSNQVMQLTSFIISQLQNNKDANQHYLGKTFKQYNFTEMARSEIIKTVGLGNIFNYIKESFFNPEVRTDIEDFDVLDKLEIAYNNFESLIRQGYSKLISLEDTPSIVSVKPEFVKREDIEESLDGEFEQGSLEEKEREYWQIGQRQLSAKASLSSEIRRLFGRLKVTDQNGKSVKDDFGFNMDTFVDPNEAINSILTWVNAATNIEEMESILSQLTEANPWLNKILEVIKEEPIRSQFFQNFRKDFLNYSVVRVEYDSNGKRQYVTEIINTQGASVTALNSITSSFKMGLMTNLIIPIKGDIEGRGRVNTESVQDIKEDVISITQNIKESFAVGQQNQVITSNINHIVNVLNKVGIPVTTNTLKSALLSDSKKKNYDFTNSKKILSSLNYILDTLLDNKDNTTYSPMIKGEKGNIYSNYKDIITIISPYIKDSIESSTYENGKMYYSFTTPSYMGKLINNLSDKLGDANKFKDFIEREYGSYKWFKIGDTWNCPWLDRIVNNESIRQGLQHKVQLSFDKTNYTDLSELSYTLSLMTEYFYDKNKKWAWYRLPILANKPSSEFVRFERLSGIKYKNQIKKGLRKVFDQEVMRMKTVLERAGNPNIEKIGAKGKIWFDIKDIDSKLLNKVKRGRLTLNDLVKDGKYIFSGSGAEFKFLSPLNSEIINKTELGQMIVDKLNGKDVNETTLTTLFNTAVDNFMSAQMKIEKANWDRLGLFDTEEITRNNKGKKETVTKFKYVSQLGDTREEVMSNLEEYVWNDMFATINIIELTATDLAYYKNVEDFQKRYSQVHAPSMRLNVSATFKDSRNKDVLYSADGLERTMYLKDSFAKSDFIPNIAKVFDNKIATLQGNQKTEMEIMKSLILQEFEDINVADAQGYSSPTSYRKKLGMQGRWSPEMEEAYQQIREGNLNINNLGIVWQPLKPFVYSQIRKTSGASTMSELKVPVQNKNSEYLLLIADAILRSGNQVNKLSAIFDFMEESAYDNGEYNGKGIDTVQFISAVNSGGMGAIDLSKAKSYAEVKQILEDSAYYDSSKREVSDNDNDRYNEQYVHSISFEDYGIQQEVPAHMSDHQQPMGSQVRILSVSDISKDASFNINGETYNRERLQKEYFHLIAENIKESYEQLKKDLNLKGSRLEQNQALSQLLQEEILKDQRYGYDLLRACSLDENGEFLIPLSDPIQSSRIQQLLNSIIKSRINKQRVQGGPAVQASAFGLSDDLNIVWQDEDGNLSTSDKFNIKKQKSVAYFECYAPIPTKEMERALLKSDGSYMSPQEALEKGIITDEMLKAIGYRIPTEDKYSILPLKIKGFVPKAAGEAIIMPKEITTITGSDFDIDKMYIMFKEFKQDTKTNWSQLKRDVLHRINTGELSKPNGKGTLRSQVDIAVDGIIEGREFSEDSFEMEVFDYYNENYSKYNTTKFLEKGNNKTGDRSNKIFDIQWAVLTNADTMEKMFNPGSFNVQKKSARIITILKSSNKYTYKQLSEKKLEELNEIVESSSNLNIVFPSTQVYFHKQNMTAGKLIGIFANNNTSHAFLSMQDIEFNIQEGEGFTFDGVTIDGSNNNKIDNLRAKDGSLISKNIAGFLAASVDAVKDPVLNYMNLNTMTANPAMVLARLGFDSDSIGLLLTQPIIEFITTEYFKRNNEGYASIEDIIDEVLENSNINYSLLEKDLVNTSFTKEELAKGLKTNINTEFQIRTLLLFKKLSTMGKDLNTLTFLTKFNSVTNAVGPSIADTFVMRERYFKFLDDMGGVRPPFNENAKDVINNNEMLSAFYESTAGDSGASALIFRNYFPHYSVAFSEILDELRGTTKGNVDSKTINKLINDFVLYKLTIGDNPVLDGSYNSRNRYINNFVREFSEYSKEILGNDFINVISIKPKSTKCPVDALESRTGGYSIDVQERIKDGWDNLIGNEDTNELGQDLFFYNLFRSGFTFSPKNPGHLASVNVRRSIPGYIEAIGNPTYEDAKVISSEFLNQFRRNHSNDIKIVPVLKPSNKIKVTFGKDVNKESTVTFTFNKFKSGMNSIIVDSNPFATTFAPVIKYEDNLYMNPISADNFVIYTKTTVLGNANNFLEYNYNEGSSMKSVINNNTSSREKTDSNSTYEVKNKKSYTEREISKAIEAVLGNTNTTIKGSKVNDITDKVLNKLGANDSFKQIVTKMVKDKLKDQC